MTDKELVQIQNQSQQIINIIEEDFDFKWDGIDYILEKGETKSFPKYLATHCAFHMGKKYALKYNKDWIKDAGKIVDKALGKETIDYNKLTIAQAKNLCKERKISLETIDGGVKNKSQLVEDLKTSH